MRKVYQTHPDQEAANHRLVRIIDESGEEYLYPKDFFVAVKLPAEVRKTLRGASQPSCSMKATGL